MNSMVDRKLHIGGRIRRDGWEVFDAIPSANVDHEGNAKDLSRFRDQTFSCVYASHVLEHFDYQQELQIALSEWLRVLQAGGKLYISVPDLDILATMVTRSDVFDCRERYEIMRMMFGGHMDEYDYHQVGLNFEFLSSFLTEVGFGRIDRVSEFGLFDDCSGLRFKSIAISLNVEATRPLVPRPGSA